MRLPCALPLIQAPMAGGPSTPALTAAVAAAGGYGFVAAGYLSPEALRAELDATRPPFGVNVFVPSPSTADQAAVQAYAARLQLEADRFDVALGPPHWDDFAYDAKIETLVDAAVHSVTFTFGCPDPAVVARLQAVGSVVGVTVTSAHEAAVAEATGADFVIAQGTEAGGHQGGFDDAEPNRTPLLDIIAAIRDSTSLPVVGAGGVMTGADAAAVLAAGAFAVQLGTALLCTPEAGTSAPYRAALLEQRYSDTIVTRAYSGRYARGLANRFAAEHHDYAPRAYPEVHHLTGPLRRAAAAAGDADVPNLWAGTGWRELRAEPARAVIERIGRELG
jgi:nitronate monooxygenase